MANKSELFETKVIRQHLSEQVAARIQKLITSGQLQVDDRLPSSHDLAHQMGVSRTVIREAIKVLEEKGLVRTVAGSGTYASNVDSNTVSESISLLIQQKGSSFEHFYELRRILEVGIVDLAVARAIPQDICALERAVERMAEFAAQARANPDFFENFVQSDLEFHTLLAKATHNPLLMVVQELVPEQLIGFIRLTAQGAGAVERTLVDHQNMLEALKAGDAQTCQELMADHIDRGMNELKQSNG
jgi:GntR family transcriptional repressor for pyruvate dehydrogenase complex